MPGDLIKFTLGQENGRSLTYHLSLEKMAHSGFHPTLYSITALLDKEFIKLGWRLRIDLRTSWNSSAAGSSLD